MNFGSRMCLGAVVCLAGVPVARADVVDDYLRKEMDQRKSQAPPFSLFKTARQSRPPPMGRPIGIGRSGPARDDF